MNKLTEKIPGILICLLIAVPAWLLGRQFPVVGGPVIAILAGMIIASFWTPKGSMNKGIKFTSKYILQTAVVLLGFGLDMGVILQTGKQSLPIIVCTISTSLIVAFVLMKLLKAPANTATLIGVGSSICGGSAIAATAPVIGADDDEVAQSISVIFFFNVLAAIIFPILGHTLGFDTTSGEAFGIFAGTAVNDTSSVTAAAATWDNMWSLGTATLDKAVTVKLTRTLAIIPITLVLAAWNARKADTKSEKFSLKRAFPLFILLFVIASLITTAGSSLGVAASVFAPLKDLSKFFIVMAMAAIGLGSNTVKLIKTGAKPLVLGASCWICITLMSLLMQHLMHLL